MTDTADTARLIDTTDAVQARIAGVRAMLTAEDGPASVTCCCVINNVIFAFSDIGHIYKVTPNPFSVQRLLTPTDAVGGGGGDSVGPWQLFTPDPGWNNVTLRFRKVPGGLQIEGSAAGGLTADATARLGVVLDGFRPLRVQTFPAVVIAGLSAGFAFCQLYPNGELMTRWSVGQGAVHLNAIVPLN